MYILQREFSAQTVALATGATAKQISDWCNQGQLIGQREPLGKGHKRTFSFFNVMEVAVALALMEIGVRSPGDAFRAAQSFAHTGHGGTGWTDSQSESAKRLPGLPFHYRRGTTFAFVAGGECSISTEHDIFVALHSLGNPGGLLVLNVSAIFNVVMHRLSMDPHQVLDTIYGSEG